MGTFLEMFACLLVLAAAATLTGRAVVAAFGIRMLMRRSPEAFAVAPFLGTAVFLLVFGWCSHSGLAAGPAAGVVLAVTGVFLAVTFFRGSMTMLWPPAAAIPRLEPRAAGFLTAAWNGGLASWLLLAGPMLVAAFLVLAPTLRGGYCAQGDVLTYLGLADWLQFHAFAEPSSVNSDHPIDWFVLVYQSAGFRMGAAFLLAFVEALVPGRRAVDVYLPVCAWAMMLNAAAIFVLCRWSFRMTRPYAGLCALMLVATYNPLSFSAVNGFFPQLFGTAYVSVLAALLSRSCAPVHWRSGTALALALCGAALLSAYSEMLPLLAAMLGVFLIVQGGAAVRRGKVLRFAVCVAVTSVVLAALGNLEFARAYTALRIQMGAVCGWHLPWSWDRFWGFAMGPRIYEPTFAPHEHTRILLTAMATVALAAGSLRLVRRRQALPLATLVGVYIALAIYFGAFSDDPWTGEQGHSWSLFKLCKWAFPVVVALQTGGLAWLATFLPRRARAAAVAVVCALFLGFGLDIHLKVARHASDGMRRFAKSSTPLVEFRELIHQLDTLDPPRIYLATNPTVGYADWNRTLVAVLLAPRPFVNTWQGTPHFEGIAWLSEPRPFPDDPETLVLAFDGLPGEPDVDRLACGLAIVPRDRPVILGVRNPQGVEDHGSGWFAWAGNEPVELELYSPRAGRVEFSCLAEAGPSLPETTRRRIEVCLPDQPPEERAFEESSRLRFVFDVSAGVSTISLACPDQKTVPSLWGGDTRACLVGLHQFRVAPIGASEQARATDRTVDR